MTPEMWLGLVFAISSVAVALAEARRYSAEAELRERVTSLEVSERARDERVGRGEERIAALEQAQRQDPYRGSTSS